MLRREGWRVNKKRVHRLWREEGLKVPEKQRKRLRLPEGTGENRWTISDPSTRTTSGATTS